MAAAVRDLLDGPVGTELSPGELDAARSLQPRWEMLGDCGLPDTVVHGDFHPGNWRSGDGALVVLDFADAHLGNPVLDGLRAIDFLPPGLRGPAAGAWITAWTAAAPRSRPGEALRIAAPLAHLAYAVRYQEFLDNIEPSEPSTTGRSSRSDPPGARLHPHPGRHLKRRCSSCWSVTFVPCTTKYLALPDQPTSHDQNDSAGPARRLDYPLDRAMQPAPRHHHSAQKPC